MDDDHDIFDAPALWRAQAARDLGLEGGDLVAAASPGAGFPAVLRSVLAAILRTDANASADEARFREPRRVVDVGAGVGGVSEWMRQETGATVIALDPSAGARRAASWLFPALEVMFGSAAATGLETSSVDVVLLTGVLSLIHDVHRVLREAERIVRPDGAVAIADLFASGTESFRSGPNWFRSVEATCSLLRSHGWMIAEVGVGTTRPADTWRHTGERVDNWITSHRSGHPGFESWMDDQLHLRRHIDDGDVIAGCIVARRGGAPNSDESRSCG